ncbi:MAG: HD domain-containing protein, partial [Elusimicrobia bacterium]|nr:HD domain-containing protein [Elusimicrobiota bacterium]
HLKQRMSELKERIGSKPVTMRLAAADGRYHEAKKLYDEIKKLFPEFIELDLESEMQGALDAAAEAMNKAKSIKSEKDIIDYCGGLGDIKSKKIKTVSTKSFTSDSLRMLRAFRFCVQLGYSIDKQTLTQIKKNAKLINAAAPERIKNEFFAVLSSPDALKYIELMDNTGILEAMFPEITVMKKSAKKYYYHKNGLFHHTTEVLYGLDSVFQNAKKYFPKYEKEIKEHFTQKFSSNVDRRNLLKFAALFHDAAKPACAAKVGDKMRFLGHEEKGAVIIKAISKRLKLSKEETEVAQKLVAAHMRPSTLTKNNTVTHKAALRFFKDLGNETLDVLVLAVADWLSYKGLKIFSPKTLKNQLVSVNFMIDEYFKYKNAPAKVKLLDGNILIKHFKIKPSPLIGAMIKDIDDKQLVGEITSKEAALKYLSKKYKKQL